MFVVRTTFFQTGNRKEFLKKKLPYLLCCCLNYFLTIFFDKKIFCYTLTLSNKFVLLEKSSANKTYVYPTFVINKHVNNKETWVCFCVQFFDKNPGEFQVDHRTLTA